MHQIEKSPALRRSEAAHRGAQIALEAMKPLVENMLRFPHNYEWTVQGLGMLRTYLSPELRLHVWNSQLRVPGVTMLHDHPWDFYSLIVAGEVIQYRYFPVSPYAEDGRDGSDPEGGWGFEPYMMQTIVCGEGGGPAGDPEPIGLVQEPQECYVEGQCYNQLATEIHQSLPRDGTVTLIRRHFRENTEHAHVFWTPDKEWVSAEPRPATAMEVWEVTNHALKVWFN